MTEADGYLTSSGVDVVLDLENGLEVARLTSLHASAAQRRFSCPTYQFEFSLMRAGRDRSKASTSAPCAVIEASTTGLADPGPRPISDTTLTVRGSAPTQHAIGNWRKLTRNNGQTANNRPLSFRVDPFRPFTSAMTCGYYRSSSPVTALPMINDHALDFRRIAEWC
jgi:hypothetical protein